MVKNIIFFAAGYFVCRYLVLGQGQADYLAKEKQVIDRIQNKVHDLVKNVAPQYSDQQISEMVIQATEGGSNESDTSGAGDPK